MRGPSNSCILSITLQIGGSAHSGGCKSVEGYKIYFGVNGGRTDIGTEYNNCDHKLYDYFKVGNPNLQLQRGVMYKLRATKQDIGPNEVLITAYVNDKQVMQVRDTGQLGRGPYTGRRGGGDAPPIDQVRVDNWPIPASQVCPYLISIND